MRFRSAFLLLLLSSPMLSARADDATKLAKVEEFFKVAKLDQLSTQIMKQAMERISSRMVQQSAGGTLTAEQQRQFSDFMDKASGIISSALSWKKLEPEYAKLYAAAYTEQQVDDILAFYKSPTGQVMVEKNPELIKQSSAIAQQHLEKAMPELQRLLSDYKTQADKTTQSAPQK